MPRPTLAGGPSDERPGRLSFLVSVRGGAHTSGFDFPVGQVRRVAAVDADQDVDETKRNVLKLLAVAGIVGAGAGGLVGGTLQFVQPPTVGISSYPRSPSCSTSTGRR